MTRFVAVLIISTCEFLSPATAKDRSIILQSTTSTANSGLYEHLLPIFEHETGVKVHVVAVGTGQALRNGRNGDGDVLLVHAKAAEEKFVADGYGMRRDDVMYNDFVIVGPPSDPAGILATRNAVAALAKIAASQSIFASRGDNSGTHTKEHALWLAAGIDPVVYSGKWYRETGSGMGATLNIAVGMDAYTLTDRATWLTFGNKRDFKILIEGDPALFNQYGIIMISPKRHRRVKKRESQKFIDWMLGQRGQEAIASFKLRGRQLFFPNAIRR